MREDDRPVSDQLSASRPNEPAVQQQAGSGARAQPAEPGASRYGSRSEAGPNPHDLLRDLHIAVYGKSWARPDHPADVWNELIGKVKSMRRGDDIAINIRDLFAAFALAGMRAASQIDESIQTIARYAYRDADAMLEERAKRDEKP